MAVSEHTGTWIHYPRCSCAMHHVRRKQTNTVSAFLEFRVQWPRARHEFGHPGCQVGKLTVYKPLCLKETCSGGLCSSEPPGRTRPVRLGKELDTLSFPSDMKGANAGAHPPPPPIVREEVDQAGWGGRKAEQAGGGVNHGMVESTQAGWRGCLQKEREQASKRASGRTGRPLWEWEPTGRQGGEKLCPDN